MQKEHTDWRGSGLEKQADHLVFPDESSVNIDLTRRYGRAIGKTRVRGMPYHENLRLYITTQNKFCQIYFVTSNIDNTIFV